MFRWFVSCIHTSFSFSCVAKGEPPEDVEQGSVMNRSVFQEKNFFQWPRQNQFPNFTTNVIASRACHSSPKLNSLRIISPSSLLQAVQSL